MGDKPGDGWTKEGRMRLLKALALTGLLAASVGGMAQAAAPSAMHRGGAARVEDAGAARNVNYGYNNGGHYRGGYHGRPYWGGYYRPYYRPYYAPPAYYRPAPYYYSPYYYPPYYYAPPVYYYGVR
jgi:hypothetical protein